MKGKLLTLKEARATEAFYWSNSYTRMGAVMDLVDQMRFTTWLRLLGETWSSFDNVWEFRYELQEMLLWCANCREMMTPKERHILATLPDLITIYRGCGPENADGICWSLDRDVAAAFPFKGRYLAAEPMLVTATVSRDEVIAYKNDREEQEIITFSAIPLAVAALSARTDLHGSSEGLVAA